MQFIREFLEEAPRKVLELRREVGLGNASEVVKQAHELKGAGATLGATALQKTMALVEKSARAGDMEHAARLLAGIEDHLSDLEIAVGGPDATGLRKKSSPTG